MSHERLAINRDIRYNLLVRGVAQLASAPRLGRGGRRFESFHPDQVKCPSFGGLFIWFAKLILPECGAVGSAQRSGR
jgi:hypothetical protein